MSEWISLVDLPRVRAHRASLENFAEKLTHFVAQRDVANAAALALAARLEGQPNRLSAAQLEWFLQRVEDAGIIPCLIGCCAESPTEVLIRCLQTDMSVSVYPAVLLSLVVGLEEEPVPEAVRTLLKKLMIKPRPALDYSLGILGHIRPDLDIPHEYLNKGPKVFSEWMAADCRRRLAGEFLDELRDFGASGLTLRREIPKVGRNDPCPCGSGKKFKKCCVDKPLDSAAYPAPPVKLPKNLRQAPLTAVLQADWSQVDSHSLELILEKLSETSLVEEAERAYQLLKTRTDLDCHSDELAYNLLRQASRLRDPESMLRTLREVGSGTWLGDLKQGLELILAHGQEVFQRLEEFSLILLRDQNLMVEFQSMLAEFYPALGIVWGRASVDEERALDSYLILHNLDLTRTELGLDGPDPLRNLWDKARAKENTRSSPPPKPPPVSQAEVEMHQSLAQANTQLRELEKKLAESQRQLTQIPAVEVQGAEDATESRRLRDRVQELKHLLRERNQERADLRKQLSEQAPAPSAPTQFSPVADPIEPTEEETQWVSAPLLPQFSKEAARQWSQLPAPLARQALRQLTNLCAGGAAAWSKVKAIHEVDGLRSIRLGLYHRLLFRSQERTLLVERIVTRTDLERTLRQMH